MQQTLSPLIREATALDAEAIARVRVLAWRAAYRGIIDDGYLARLSIDADRDRLLRDFDVAVTGSFTRVAAEAGKVVGFVTAGPVRENREPRRGEVWMIYLLPELRHRGLGTLLMRSAARGLDRRGMRSMIVRTLARNDDARRFYERLGGRPAGEREISVGAQRLAEVAYCWDTLEPLIGRGPVADG
jgi:ribosomal protein S18 acetylase RimI-like enzyme